MNLWMATDSFKNWQAQQHDDLDFLAECRRLELGHQIARLCLLRSMTQTELADKVEKNGLRLPI